MAKTLPDPREDVGTPPKAEASWNAVKLIVVGAVALAACFAWLWMASPNGNPH